jgi:hypothetical protein
MLTRTPKAAVLMKEDLFHALETCRENKICQKFVEICLVLGDQLLSSVTFDLLLTSKKCLRYCNMDGKNQKSPTLILILPTNHPT